MSDKIEIAKSTYEFCMAEFNEVHALCDAAEIPRKSPQGGVFSAAQRVRILTYTVEGARAAIRSAKGDVAH